MTRLAGTDSDPSRDVLPFGPLLLLLLPFVTFGRFALGDELANADVFLAYRPAHAFLSERLQHGDIPLWTSGISGGFPLAFSEYGWFSPLVWIPLVAAGSHAGYYLAVAFHVSLAALATYGLARTWEATRFEATIAGLIFSHSLLVIGGAPLLNQAGSYWVAPALLWVVARTIDWHPLAPPLGGVVVALGLLGGHPQVTMVAAMPAMGWAAFALVRSRDVARRFALVVLFAAACIGVGVASVRILPTLALLDASVRQGGLSNAARSLGSAHPFDLVAGFFFPSLQLTRVLAPHWAAYVGPLPLGLAVLAVARWRGLARRIAARSVPATLARQGPSVSLRSSAQVPETPPSITGLRGGDPSSHHRDRSGRDEQDRPIPNASAPSARGTPTGEGRDGLVPSPFVMRRERGEAPMSAAAASRLPWLGGLAVAGVLLGVGQHATLASWVGGAPIISLFRDPSRFLLWTVTAVSLVAPFGMRLAIDEVREHRRPGRPARAASTRIARRGLRDRLRLRGRLAAVASGDGPVGTTWWFGLACAVTFLFAVASWTFVTQEPLLRPLAEARVDVGARVLGAAIDPRGDYPPEFYRARFEAGWRRLGEAVDVRDPAVAAPLLSLIGAGWWWAWGRGRGDAAVLAGILTVAPLMAYGQVRLPAIASADVALARESTFGPISKIAATSENPDQPTRIMSWLPLATDFGLRTQSVARGDTDAETDAVSYQFLVRMVSPNLAMGVATDARLDGDRDARVTRLASIDGYENLVTREQALLASAIGSERSPGAGDSAYSLGSTGLRGRREAISQRWGILAASGVTAIVTATSHAPVDAPRGVVIDAGIIPAAGLAPAIDMHRLARPWPRIFATTGWEVVRTAEEALRREEMFDPTLGPRVVLTSLASGTNVGSEVNVGTPAGPALSVPVRVTRDDEDAITIEVDAPAPTAVVVLDAMTPGWTATIDAQRATIVTANVTFRAVIVPSGSHVVTMNYVPERWATARALTAVSLVILAAWLLNVGTRRRLPNVGATVRRSG